MKQTLLLITFFLFSGMAFGQTSFSAGLKFVPSTQKIDIKIFPNPVMAELGISDNTQVKTIKIFSTLGGEVKRFDYEAGTRYYVGDLPRGIYLVQFSDAGNKVITTKRMKKQ